jgi:hypothetical protein
MWMVQNWSQKGEFGNGTGVKRFGAGPVVYRRAISFAAGARPLPKSALWRVNWSKPILRGVNWSKPILRGVNWSKSRY